MAERKGQPMTDTERERILSLPDVPDINVGELISRQAAIDAIEERKGEKYETD